MSKIIRESRRRKNPLADKGNTSFKRIEWKYRNISKERNMRAGKNKQKSHYHYDQEENLSRRRKREGN